MEGGLEAGLEGEPEAGRERCADVAFEAEASALAEPFMDGGLEAAASLEPAALLLADPFTDGGLETISLEACLVVSVSSEDTDSSSSPSGSRGA
mmetsp:Transcript_2193/g.6620  ORF Transcript_2193/g.6620 Transcript_2193/m.6620 type:complete len:94 (+) Transcript_2193:663-944(+)